MWTSCRREALVAEADGLPVVAVDGLPVVAAVVVHVWGVLLLVGSAVVVRPPAVVFQLDGLPVVAVAAVRAWVAHLPVAAVGADPCLLVVVAVERLLGQVVLLVVLVMLAAGPCPRAALAVDPYPHLLAALAADLCPRLLEVIGITMVLPVPLGVWALPSSERLLSRPLQLPLAP